MNASAVHGIMFHPEPDSPVEAEQVFTAPPKQLKACRLPRRLFGMGLAAIPATARTKRQSENDLLTPPLQADVCGKRKDR
jgi:hypothetical protein